MKPSAPERTLRGAPGEVGDCKCEGRGYARILVQRYLQRTGATMNDESPLIRQWILLRTLAARKYGATVKELAREAGVSIKTIRRDLETFQTAGFPLREVVGDFGRKKWHLESAKPPADLNFTWDEAAALYLGRRLLDPLMGTMFWQAAREAFRKIQAVLEPVPREYLDKFATMFCQTMIGTHDYSKKADLIDSLMQAIEDSQAVAMTYQSLAATEPVTYTVWPYGLVYHRGSLYLVGRTRRHEDTCHWKVDRIEAVTLKDQRFQRPEEFDLQKHLAKSFGVFQGDGEVCVKVRFLPAVARYVGEATWHPSQKLTRQRDGSVVAEFTLDGTEEIKRWIMSFGKCAQVLEPEELRHEIIQELREAVLGHEEPRADTRQDARKKGYFTVTV
jgi:predicted DNA-binding transcriptional regulator YafY